VVTASRVRLRLVAGSGVAGLVTAVVVRTLDGAWQVDDAAWLGLAVLPLYGVGLYLATRRPDHPQARRLLLAGSSMITGVAIEDVAAYVYRDTAPGHWFWLFSLIYSLTSTVGSIAAVSLVALFPDGVAERPWMMRGVRALWALLAVPPLLLVTSPVVVVDAWLPVSHVSVPSPFAVSWLEPLAPFLAAVYGSYVQAYVAAALLLWRYFRSTGERRLLMRWFAWTVLVAVAVYLAVAGLAVVGTGPGWLTDSLLGVVSVAALMMLTANIVIGVLKYRLFDLDVVVRRSFVFALLWVGIAAVYVAVAAAPGLAFGGRIPVQLAVLVTILVAVAFQPLRRRLELVADRVVFGRRVNRYQLVRSFGATLEASIDLTDLLPQLAQTVRDGLGASWVQVSLRDEDAGGKELWLDPQGTAGTPAGAPGLSDELRRAGTVIGRIDCGPKAGGYDDQDRELLRTLTGQAATAIANVRLAAQLSERLSELARSRARIVTAADAERRRIERNLHDGAQQSVVALITKLRLARNQVNRGDSPAELLGELQADARELLTELRELAQGIHPPVLSDNGLVAALEARTGRLALPVAVRADQTLRTQRLNEDVEGAAYYMVCEALTNVVKHAGACETEVALFVTGNCLQIEVSDDGAGFDAVNGHGTGLTNIRDRVEALGGRLRIDSRPRGGTRVRAQLPVTVADA
jgi:signal transduction histidine kinase